MHHEDGAGGQELDGEVSVGHRVHRVVGGFGKAQGGGGLEPIHRIGGGGQGARPQGALVHPLQTVLQPGHVPAEHIGVGHHVVGEGGGLGPLEVGVAGHDGVQVGLRLLHQHLLQVQHHVDNLGDLLLDVQAEVHRHLVVAAAGGVEALARVADTPGAQGLDVHVDVLVLQGELHLVRLDVRQNGLEAVDNLLRLVLLDDALLAQHGGVGDGARDILFVHPGVKGDGGVEVVDQGIGLLLEPSGPEFHAKSLLFWTAGGRWPPAA